MKKNLILQQIQKLKLNRSQSVQHKKEIPVRCVRKEQWNEQKASEKSSSNTQSIRSRTHTQTEKLHLFRNMTFCFPFIDVDLSPKRIQCMSKSIIEQSGKIIQFNDQQLEQKVDYLLINSRFPINLALKKLGGKIVFRQILDYNFVLHCLREQVLLAISTYSLHKNRQNELEEEEEDERTITMAVAPQKIVKKDDGEHFRTITFGQGQNKTDIQTEAEEEEETHSLVPKSKTYDIPLTQIMEYDDFQPFLKSEKKKTLDKSTFLCQKGPAGSQPFSMNKFICDELMKLQKIYEAQKDIGRKIAYLKAVSAIKTLDKQIQSERDVEKLRGVGSKIIKKVKELLQTGKLSKLQKFHTSQKRVVLEQFNKIWGVGPATSEQLYAKGIRSIEELRERQDLLNKNQKIGLRHYQDFQTKIPRQKVGKIFDYVKQVFAQMVDVVDLYHIEVCGSYRRGRSHCGDIDILISRKDGYFEKKMLLNLVLELQSRGLLTDHLSFPSPSKDHSSISYMGVCKFQGDIFHRIDMKYYHINQYPYALLYFTGSDMFNRSMRLYASKLGIQLNDHGAIAKRRNPTDDFWEGPIPICRSQEEIFQFLGLDYKTPRERDV